MKSLATLLVLSILVVFTWTGSAPGPTAASPAPGGGPTGALGLMQDPNYGPGTHVIDLGTTGMYDAERWMVILDYESFTVQAGAVVTFLNHETRAPVVIRATGPIAIDGTIDVSGEHGHAPGDVPRYAEPGPGGWRGGRGSYYTASGSAAGLGPGGGFQPIPDDWTVGGPASHRTLGMPESAVDWGAPGPTYGSPAAHPLRGGSGGSSGGYDYATTRNAGGGAGGGAVLIGSDVGIELGGTIAARGGNGVIVAPGEGYGGAGSGGTVRLFAPAVVHEGSLIDARGGVLGTWLAGDGCVRIEVDGPFGFEEGGQITPLPSVAYALGQFLPSVPSVALVARWDPEAAGGAGDWVALPGDPHAVISPPPLADLQITAAGPTLFRVEGRDVPLGAELHVRVTRAQGQAVIDSTHTMGEVAGSTLALSWTDVTLDLSGGVYALQVRAELP